MVTKVHVDIYQKVVRTLSILRINMSILTIEWQSITSFGDQDSVLISENKEKGALD